MTKRLLLFAALLGLSAGTAHAAYPERPITLIVPFAAGGPTDVVARIVGDHMSRTLGQQVVVENVTGAGGTTGTTRAAQAAPDLKYDPLKDFVPIGLAAGTPILIVARKNFPPKDLKEFISYAKANSEKLNEAHAGVGSVSFTTCSLLNSSRPAASRRTRSRRRSARRRSLTCRPPRKAGCRNSRSAPGTPCSRRKGRPRRW